MSKTSFFEFSKYTFEPAKKRAVFHYKTILPGQKPIFWTETIVLPKVPETKRIPKELLQKILESLHIMLGISYYKFHYATRFALPYRLAKPEAEFWNTVYKKGLGEYLYRNNLDPRKIAQFQPSNSIAATHYSLQTIHLPYLVGIGGGKDSIVAAELLKQHGEKPTAFVIESRPHEIIDAVIKTASIPALRIIRQLDAKVHEKHPYNGHVPVSAVYAFLGVFSSMLYGHKGFVVANEYSSNFGNITHKGMEINHQWSKSFEFEKLFSDYVKTFLTPDITYFSLLRPLYEIRIVEQFARYPRYFKHFSSCNRNFAMNGKTHRGLWCLACPKCAFAFTMLSAFLPKKELLGIFGRNLYEDQALLALFKDILGLGATKPFDCVGTFQEAQTAFSMASKKHAGSFMMRQLAKRVAFSPKVFAAQKESLVPDHLKFLGMHNAVLLGYGREGMASERYLKKYYPDLPVLIADQRNGKKYLARQQRADIAVRTPGIKKELATIPCTTATNIFFSHIRSIDPSAIIVGVTGSKGKSTTASLIYEMLKTGGKKAVLLGNIGKPMLEALLKPISKGTIYVLELSSFQLDDIAFSPDTSVITTLFPEHMDYHSSARNYYQAKKRMLAFAHRRSIFVYHQQNAALKAWAKAFCGRAIPFAAAAYPSRLLGEHNQRNIGAAAAVARALGVDEAAIRKAAAAFKGLEHRLEFVGIFKGIAFYNDAISTTPDSTIAALKALRNVDTIFLGGQDRGYDFSTLEKALKQYTIKNLVLFPDSGTRMLSSYKGFNVLETSSMREAVAFAYRHTAKGSICLLSCASPSYSLWKNFEEKGREFKHYVTLQGSKKAKKTRVQSAL